MKFALKLGAVSAGLMICAVSYGKTVENAFLDPKMEKEAWLLAQEGGKSASTDAKGGATKQKGSPEEQNAQPSKEKGNVTEVEPLPSPKLDINQEVLNKVAPMDPALIRQIIIELEKRRQAASTPAVTDIKAAVSSFDVDLSPGATPPVVRIARGQGAVVTFLDSAGNPWPIEAAQNFYSQAMDVKQLSAHVLSVSARSEYLRGSVGVMLKGLPTPVTFTVIPAGNSTDYRVDLRVPGLAPGAVPQVSSGGVGTPVGSADLMAFLYGQTPEGAKRLKVVGNSSVSAWQSAKGDLIVRTAAMVASPAWSERLPSADGTSVYRLPPTPVVLVSENGKISNIQIDGIVPTANAPTLGFAK